MMKTVIDNASKQLSRRSSLTAPEMTVDIEFGRLRLAKGGTL